MASLIDARRKVSEDVNIFRRFGIENMGSNQDDLSP